MLFNCPGYKTIFIQRQKCTDESAHQFTDIYTFFSPITKLKYVIRAEYHQEDVFGVKFYAKCHRKSDFKYNKIINKGDVCNILMTVINLMPEILTEFPKASFFYHGSASVDESRRAERFESTQRYRIYNYLVEKQIGINLFEHYYNDLISGYLFVNRNSGMEVSEKKDMIFKMLQKTYKELYLV